MYKGPFFYGQDLGEKYFTVDDVNHVTGGPYKRDNRRLEIFENDE